MGRQIDLDSPLSVEDKAYLRGRGRGHLIHANERRFGKDGTATPAEHEAAGVPSASAFYDNQERERAVYDQGGAPLPGTVLSYDSGRVADRDNGQFVEFEPPLNSPGQFAHRIANSEEGFSGEPDEGDVDDDIAEHVQSLSDEDLDKQAKELVLAFGDGTAREDKEDPVAIALHDQRHGTVTTPGEPLELAVDPQTGKAVSVPGGQKALAE